MTKRFTKQILNKNGVTLIFVILVLLVMTILGVAVFTLFSSNLATAKSQQDSVKAHFLAISGVEIAFAAVLDNTDGDPLIVSYFKRDDITSTMIPLTDTIELDEGEVEIEISSYIENEERYIKISAKGIPNNTTVTRLLNMHFNARFPEIQRWD